MHAADADRVGGWLGSCCISEAGCQVSTLSLRREGGRGRDGKRLGQARPDLGTHLPAYQCSREHFVEGGERD